MSVKYYATYRNVLSGQFKYFFSEFNENLFMVPVGIVIYNYAYMCVFSFFNLFKKKV